MTTTDRRQSPTVPPRTPGLPGLLGLPGIDRRAFVAGVIVTATGPAASCGDRDGDGDGTPPPPGPSLPGGLPGEAVPPTDVIYSWVEEVFAQGIRRPGYPADVWAEEYVAGRFRELGLERVRFEPVQVTRWEPRSWSLAVTPEGGETATLECFPVPYSAAADGLEAELVAYDPAEPAAVAGKASFYDAEIIRVPPALFASAGSAPTDLSGRVFDPDGTFSDGEHVLPFTALLQGVVEPSVEAGAAAFIGALVDYPGDSYKYFVPYDGRARPIPGVWVRGSDGAWLHEQLARGPVRIRLTVDSAAGPFESHNVIGELPGADDDVVMVGSHHDGPWASAVEDGSGIALVLAQAAFWAAQPPERRPHRMVFVLQGGHMSGGAGLHAYIEAHRPELPAVVLEVHLEHAALDFAEENGSLSPTGQCVPRWFFTSRIPRLEAAVADALATEDLRRSIILAPDAIGEQPPTDGAFYHTEGVPVVHFLSAPFYLFDEIDRLDKVDKDNLVPLTRATIRIIESTRGISAAAMRAAAE